MVDIARALQGDHRRRRYAVSHDTLHSLDLRGAAVVAHTHGKGMPAVGIDRHRHRHCRAIAGRARERVAVVDTHGVCEGGAGAAVGIGRGGGKHHHALARAAGKCGREALDRSGTAAHLSGLHSVDSEQLVAILKIDELLRRAVGGTDGIERGDIGCRRRCPQYLARGRVVACRGLICRHHAGSPDIGGIGCLRIYLPQLAGRLIDAIERAGIVGRYRAEKAVECRHCRARAGLGVEHTEHRLGTVGKQSVNLARDSVVGKVVCQHVAAFGDIGVDEGPIGGIPLLDKRHLPYLGCAAVPYVSAVICVAYQHPAKGGIEILREIGRVEIGKCAVAHHLVHALGVGGGAGGRVVVGVCHIAVYGSGCGAGGICLHEATAALGPWLRHGTGPAGLVARQRHACHFIACGGPHLAGIVGGSGRHRRRRQGSQHGNDKIVNLFHRKWTLKCVYMCMCLNMYYVYRVCIKQHARKVTPFKSFFQIFSIVSFINPHITVQARQ